MSPYIERMNIKEVALLISADDLTCTFCPGRIDELESEVQQLKQTKVQTNCVTAYSYCVPHGFIQTLFFAVLLILSWLAA